MDEIKIILRVKLDQWDSHCKLVCFANTKSRYVNEYNRLKETLCLGNEVRHWDYRPSRFSSSAREYIESNKNIPGIIVITSQKGVDVVRAVTINGLYFNDSRRLCVDYNFEDYVLCEKTQLVEFLMETMDDKNRFLGSNARGTNQMVHLVDDSAKLYQLIHNLKDNRELSQEIKKKKLIHYYGFNHENKYKPIGSGSNFLRNINFPNTKKRNG